MTSLPLNFTLELANAFYLSLSVYVFNKRDIGIVIMYPGNANDKLNIAINKLKAIL